MTKLPPLKIFFSDTAPANVRWGVCDYPVANAKPVRMVIGITNHNAVCISAFECHGVNTALKDWKEYWPHTTFTRDDKAVQSLIKKNDALNLNLHMRGTAFQQSVWKALTKIPVGKTVTYAELAQRVGKPKASRAVGSACGKNPIPLIVPCHRVLASNGGLGGFSSGLPVKKDLLKAEGITSYKEKHA